MTEDTVHTAVKKAGFDGSHNGFCGCWVSVVCFCCNCNYCFPFDNIKCTELLGMKVSSTAGIHYVLICYPQRWDIKSWES